MAIIAALACIGTSGCGKRDTASPVATPSVQLPGGPIESNTLATLRYRFAVAPDAPPFSENYMVFVHALDPSGRTLWSDDHAPVTPTREWKPGSLVEYTRETLIPASAPAGQVELEIGLYSPKTGERLPLAGTTKGLRGYRVATLDVKRGDAPLYRDGWNNAEVADGVEWRWTKAVSTMAFRNPRSDATLVLVVDQPILELPPAEVQVRLRDMVLATFQLAPGVREVHRVPVPASALIDAVYAPITLTVDHTFVPKTIARLHNPDARELGIRVFSAYFQHP
jgi:hypothetical protein